MVAILLNLIICFLIYIRSDPNTNTFDDLAIIKLKKPIKITENLRPICIGLNAKMNDQVTLQAYGIVNCVHKKKGEKSKETKNLMQTELIVDAMEHCKNLYNAKSEMVTSKHICVNSGENESISCPG